MFQKTVNDPRVQLSEGTFDNTKVPDGWADLIVIATVSRSYTTSSDNLDLPTYLRTSCGKGFPLVSRSQGSFEGIFEDLETRWCCLPTVEYA